MLALAYGARPHQRRGARLPDREGGLRQHRRRPGLRHVRLVEVMSHALESAGLGATAPLNIVAGFMITDRMLKMFKREPTKGSK